MEEFKFYQPIQIRYSDIDAQWHVNNAQTVSLIEQARFSYLIARNLWDGRNYLDLGLIVADVHVSYLAPILLTQKVCIGVRVAHLGNKSLQFEYVIEDEGSHHALARAETIMVAYDYHTLSTIPVPAEWRKKIAAFEGIPEHEA